MENCSRDLKWAPFLIDCASNAQSSVPDPAGVGDGAKDGTGDRVGSGAVVGAEVGERGGSAGMDEVGVRALVEPGSGVGGAAQEARKSASTMKAIAFLTSLPFLSFDPSVVF